MQVQVLPIPHVMGCISCKERQERLYQEMLDLNVGAFFAAHPCYLCNSIENLDFLNSHDEIWTAMAERAPWHTIRPYLEGNKAICNKCAEAPKQGE